MRGTMPRFGMTNLQPSFGRVFLASQNWIEIELAEGLELSLDHCYELERIFRAEIDEPFVLLGHCRYPNELQFSAKARISTFPGCAAVAIVVHTEACAASAADIIAVAEIQQGNVRAFRDETSARDWLQSELSQARSERVIPIQLRSEHF
jgi:hypothetical protein